MVYTSTKIWYELLLQYTIRIHFRLNTFFANESIFSIVHVVSE